MRLVCIALSLYTGLQLADTSCSNSVVSFCVKRVSVGLEFMLPNVFTPARLAVFAAHALPMNELMENAAPAHFDGTKAVNMEWTQNAPDLMNRVFNTVANYLFHEKRFAEIEMLEKLAEDALERGGGGGSSRR